MVWQVTKAAEWLIENLDDSRWSSNPLEEVRMCLVAASSHIAISCTCCYDEIK